MEPNSFHVVKDKNGHNLILRQISGENHQIPKEVTTETTEWEYELWQYQREISPIYHETS